ncbi:glutamine amidotransferase-like class 1 domain-containing protein 3A, mitochondrial [Manacus vitellinus]|uniref:glutamine amidotransferase-like class 1 domain-containing protein 3A, mitochondrial n=1 Tax=Manacus vitellinus TaxID=328815 RepID=UPI00115F3E36|nr:glutamine amidotransferase-like class 1 domain-containing protein 3A, mitochondrial [Manacus vitellinus]
MRTQPMHLSPQLNLGSASSVRTFLVIGLFMEPHCYSVSEREHPCCSGWIQQQAQTQQGRAKPKITLLVSKETGLKMRLPIASVHWLCRKTSPYVRTTGDVSKKGDLISETGSSRNPLVKDIRELTSFKDQDGIVKIFAPNTEQRDVVNHLKGSPTEEKRNVLVESARLARGNIQDLAELKAAEFDAVIFPGGFGVAKNLCSWAVDGKDCTVNEHVNSTLQAFHSAKKPIGLCCISPVLAAKVFPGCEVTVGQDKNVDGRFPDAETASAIAELGCKHICKNVNESHVDKANKIVTTCAFMCKAPLHEIFDGIGTMVQEVLKLA